jgi:hypothetical protein
VSLPFASLRSGDLSFPTTNPTTGNAPFSLLGGIQTDWKPTCSKLVLHPVASARHGIFSDGHVLVPRDPAQDFRTWNALLNPFLHT